MARGKRKSEKQEKEPEYLQKTNEEKTVIDSAETDKKNDLEKTYSSLSEVEKLSYERHQPYPNVYPIKAESEADLSNPIPISKNDSAPLPIYPQYYIHKCSYISNYPEQDNPLSESQPQPPQPINEPIIVQTVVYYKTIYYINSGNNTSYIKPIQYYPKYYTHMIQRNMLANGEHGSDKGSVDYIRSLNSSNGEYGVFRSIHSEKHPSELKDNKVYEKVDINKEYPEPIHEYQQEPVDQSESVYQASKNVFQMTVSEYISVPVSYVVYVKEATSSGDKIFRRKYSTMYPHPDDVRLMEAEQEARKRARYLAVESYLGRKDEKLCYVYTEKVGQTTNEVNEVSISQDQSVPLVQNEPIVNETYTLQDEPVKCSVSMVYGEPVDTLKADNYQDVVNGEPVDTTYNGNTYHEPVVVTGVPVDPLPTSSTDEFKTIQHPDKIDKTSLEFLKYPYRHYYHIYHHYYHYYASSEASNASNLLNYQPPEPPVVINDFHNIENDAALRKLEENYERIKKEKEELRPSFASKVITSLGITAAACGVVSSVYSNPKLTTITGLGVLVLTFLGQWNM